MLVVAGLGTEDDVVDELALLTLGQRHLRGHAIGAVLELLGFALLALFLALAFLVGAFVF